MVNNVVFRGTGLVAFMLCAVLATASPARAHCDTLDGPVIKDARAALEKKDPAVVLKWVKKDHEGELEAAFNEALAERAKGVESAEKADTKFFETLVRIHRAGEGALYSGLKPAGAVEPIVVEADAALERGVADELTAKMTAHLTGAVKERFDRVIEKKKHMNDSVEAGREYVEAYVEYMHYLEAVHGAVAGKGGHHDEAGPEAKERHGAE